VRSSGHPELDSEVMAMIQRAQPLPAFPPQMTQSSVQLVVPIRFSLR
jgi:protein TonB